MAQADLSQLVNAVNAELTDPKRNHRIGLAEGEPHRFEVYHAGMSVCSQKVRCTLAEKGVPFVSHEMSILNSKGIFSEEVTPAENYAPSYVRLRMLGGEQAGLSFVAGYSGSSSVGSEGFDACVVPTLVDLEKTRVIVDSKAICEYLDKEISSGTPLIPEDGPLKEAVMEQVDIVDDTPQPALLYGFHPDDDQRPDFIKAAMTDVYDLKLIALRSLIEANKDDERLVAAYESKIAKELGGKVFAHNAEDQRATRDIAQGIINRLNAHLEKSEEEWICGPGFTLADLTWGVNLFRMHWLGFAALWKDMPLVDSYANKLYQRPSLWTQVIKFPSPLPESPHTEHLTPPSDLSA